MTTCLRLLAPVLVATTFGACAPSPRQRPLQTSPIASSGATLQSVRQQLQGRWTLVSLTATSVEGKSTTAEAAGSLVSDAFGNLEIEYRLTEAGRQTLAGVGIAVANSVISTRGRVVINVDQQSIAYVDEASKPFDAMAAAGRANPFALERTRYYVFGADGTLTLSTRHDDGKDAVVSRWKKG